METNMVKKCCETCLIQQGHILSPQLAMLSRCMAFANGPEGGAPEVTTPQGALR